ncbi:hypothetical protein ACEPAI_879 [Sanghuangporus weigelae]
MSTLISPLHPEIIPKLDPEYAAYYNANLADRPGIHEIPWDPAIRKSPPIAGASEPLKVGLVKDIRLSKFFVRVFWPEDPSNAPESGWPVFLFFHGGGWTLGNIDTENHFCTTMCLKARCVVVAVDYRLGPENPYPAAVEDAEEAFRWVLERGPSELKVNTSKFAVGGSSSGANLAAIITHKAALNDSPTPLTFQLLVVPVTDNTASESGAHASWQENKNTPSLTPAKMLWFRDNYTPNPEDWKKWDNSPIFAPEESFKRVPDAWVAVAELDILRDEGIAYAEKIKNAGHNAEVKVYKGSPHPIMAMDAVALSLKDLQNPFRVLQSGRNLIADAVDALKRSFYGDAIPN